MKIAICDDSASCLKDIKQTLESCEAMTPSVCIKQFSSGIGLVDHYKSHEGFDLVFLDV